MLSLIAGHAVRTAARPITPVAAEPERPTNRHTTVVLATGAAAAGFAMVMIRVGWRGYHSPWWAFALAQTVGLSFLTAGLIAWWRRPANRLGPLMVLGGAAWYLSHLQDTGNPVLFALGYWWAYLPLVIYGHLALAYPDGRIASRATRWVVVALYVSYLALQGARYLAEGATTVGWDPGPITAWANAVSVNGLVCNAVVAAIVVRRWRAASRPARWAHAPVWLTTLYTAAVLTVGAGTSAATPPGIVRKLIVLAYGLGLIVVPFACLSGLLRVRLAHVRVADLVVKLERTADPARLRDLLADALSDPTLTLGFWSSGGDGADACGYVDADGRPVALPEPGGGRAVTYVGEGDRPLAVLVHDPALADQRSLVRSAVAATRLALENARLQAVLRAQVAELRASRARLAQAALDERRKIERDLHDGVQQRLLRLSWLAKQAAAAGGPTAGPALDQLAEEARVTHAELRELAQGIHPSAVTEHGLAVAIEEYALRVPHTVTVDIPAGRRPSEVEVTAYFVIVEAVVNAVKHAGATEVGVRARHRDGRLRLEVRDDGAGGADSRRGTGLRGLRDRVGALGGTFTVDSPPGRGTTVRAELPCA